MMPTHEPTDEPTWQESNECHAYDPDSGIGFVTASGVFANAGTGLAWVSAVAPIRPDRWQCFHRTRNDVPIVDGDRSSARNGVSSLHWEWITPGSGRLTVDEPDCQIDIEFIDFYPEAHWGAAGVPGAPGGHVESSGRVRGSLVLAGRRHEIDALGHRDQSWGARANEPVRSHAWFAGTCGPELSFTAENLIVASDDHAASVRSGYVVHNGLVDPIIDPALEYTMAWDLFSPTAVHGTLRCESGASFDIETLDRAPTLLNRRTWSDEPGHLAATDTLFRVRCNGNEGIADLNLMPNATAGRQAPSLLAGTSLVDGLWEAPRAALGEPGTQA